MGQAVTRLPGHPGPESPVVDLRRSRSRHRTRQRSLSKARADDARGWLKTSPQPNSPESRRPGKRKSLPKVNHDSTREPIEEILSTAPPKSRRAGRRRSRSASRIDGVQERLKSTLRDRSSDFIGTRRRRNWRPSVPDNLSRESYRVAAAAAATALSSRRHQIEGNQDPYSRRARSYERDSRWHKDDRLNQSRRERNNNRRERRSAILYPESSQHIPYRSKPKASIHVEAIELTNAPSKKDCIVCTNSRSLRHFPKRPPTAGCTHEINTCKSCLRSWIQSEFESKMFDQIGCPECAIQMQYEDIQEFAPSQVFRRYDRLSTKATLEAIPGFRWCMAKNCKSGQVHEEATPRFRCLACKASHCIAHNIPWHKGETCAEYDYRTDGKIKKAENEASRKLIKETAKKCPGCKWYIQKNYGCDHMTCSKCKHEFCWVCLAPYKPIRDQGNQMHREDCEYRMQWVGPPVLG
ncbi:hypothetical protein CC78DRAFT_5996 [Lojkania enalia]|uniref:RBR-type E3 ubiquitin transferase n=1 Tax=Lojkania enalia TaxID=147567 RepID=A0A9P4NCT6_9PLEO|nr:hypothetical protein CC78DRAFT_5996 [Didymosphaeria enalia]